MKSIKDSLLELNSIYVSLFCLLAVERLLPVYKAFCDLISADNTELDDRLNEAFILLTQGKCNAEEIKTAVESLIPDSDDYVEALADQAQCVPIALAYTAEYFYEHDFSLVEYVLDKVEEAIDIYGYEGGEAESISSTELEWQQELVKIIQSMPDLSIAMIAGVRDLNRSHSIPAV